MTLDSVSMGLAFGGGPMVFGLVAAVGGIPAAFLAGAGLAVVGAVGTVAALRRPAAPAPA